MASPEVDARSGRTRRTASGSACRVYPRSSSRAPATSRESTHEALKKTIDDALAQ
jgi:hypothetical protein